MPPSGQAYGDLSPPRGTLWRVKKGQRNWVMNSQLHEKTQKQLALHCTPINLPTEHIRSRALLLMAQFNSLAFLLHAILLLGSGLDISLI